VLWHCGYRLPRERWRDTMVKALAHSLPGSLGDLCDILKIPTDKAKDKDPDIKKKREKQMLFVRFDNGELSKLFDYHASTIDKIAGLKSEMEGAVKHGRLDLAAEAIGRLPATLRDLAEALNRAGMGVGARCLQPAGCGRIPHRGQRAAPTLARWRRHVGCGQWWRIARTGGPQSGIASHGFVAGAHSP
jgi:hypothetical protein